MKTYQCIVSHEGGWWMIKVPEIDGLTQARDLAEVRQNARSLIAVTLDLPMEEVEISVRLVRA